MSVMETTAKPKLKSDSDKKTHHNVRCDETTNVQLLQKRGILKKNIIFRWIWELPLKPIIKPTGSTEPIYCAD